MISYKEQALYEALCARFGEEPQYTSDKDGRRIMDIGGQHAESLRQRFYPSHMSYEAAQDAQRASIRAACNGQSARELTRMAVASGNGVAADYICSNFWNQLSEGQKEKIRASVFRADCGW